MRSRILESTLPDAVRARHYPFDYVAPRQTELKAGAPVAGSATQQHTLGTPIPGAGLPDLHVNPTGPGPVGQHALILAP